MVWVVLVLTAVPACASSDSPRPEVVEVMRTVCDWQLANEPEYWTWRSGRRDFIDDDSWIRAVFYLGVMETYRTTGDAKYLQATKSWATRNEWLLGPRDTHADDHCIGQVFLQLHDENPELARIANLRDTMDRLIESDPHGVELWSWCDALFMAAPVLAHLSRATDSPRYRNAMHGWWSEAVEFFYDPAENLFFRDERWIVRGDFQGRLERNGAKAFWSRGNGWVLAACARVMEYLPDDESREPYERLMREMASRIVELQGPDGAWRVSLLDPDSFPVAETSGTALFCYALAWGVNHGVLPKEPYRTAAEGAWEAILQAIDEDGRVGYVQKPADAPRPVLAQDTMEFGAGAVLMAAGEISRMQ